MTRELKEKFNFQATRWTVINTHFAILPPPPMPDRASRGECLIRSLNSTSTYRRPFLAALPIFSRPAIFLGPRQRFPFSGSPAFTLNRTLLRFSGDSATREMLLLHPSFLRAHSSLSIRYRSLGCVPVADVALPYHRYTSR